MGGRRLPHRPPVRSFWVKNRSKFSPSPARAELPPPPTAEAYAFGCTCGAGLFALGVVVAPRSR